jgi:hypothetical protein
VLAHRVTCALILPSQDAVEAIRPPSDARAAISLAYRVAYYVPPGLFQILIRRGSEVRR